MATLLITSLDPGFFVRDRPDRASPRRTKKAGGFPARKPDEPNVTTLTQRIELHSLDPARQAKKQGHWLPNPPTPTSQPRE